MGLIQGFNNKQTPFFKRKCEFQKHHSSSAVVEDGEAAHFTFLVSTLASDHSLSHTPKSPRELLATRSNAWAPSLVTSESLETSAITGLDDHLTLVISRIQLPCCQRDLGAKVLLMCQGHPISPFL